MGHVAFTAARDPDVMHGEAEAVAWVESPLQLLAAAEHAAATGTRPDVAFRLTGEHMSATARALLDRGAPFATCVPYLGIPWRLLAVSPRWAVGDALSGQFRAAITALRPREVTLLDDGAQTLHLAGALLGRAPYGRPGRREPRLAVALGELASGRLGRLAVAGRLSAFTAFADREPLRALAGVGVPVTPNRFAWTRATAAPIDLPTRRVVLGSALSADGRLDERTYLAWIARVAGDGPVAYLPHRREPAATRARVAAIDGVLPVATLLPVELALAGAPGPLEVHALPTSALTTLAAVLDGSGSALRPTPLVSIGA